VEKIENIVNNLSLWWTKKVCNADRSHVVDEHHISPIRISKEDALGNWDHSMSELGTTGIYLLMDQAL